MRSISTHPEHDIIYRIKAGNIYDFDQIFNHIYSWLFIRKAIEKNIFAENS